jgi:hypothetical protein
VSSENRCDQLEKLNQEALHIISEVRKIRRSRDLNFFEDADLNGQKYDSITALIKHLLAGHAGQPCPAGSRPIVVKNAARDLQRRKFWKLRPKTTWFPAKASANLSTRL